MSDSTRRQFIVQLGALAGSFLLTCRFTKSPAAVAGVLHGSPPTDESVCKQKFALAERNNLTEKPIGDVITAIGVSFIGSPYVAHSLEQPGDEQLVVNLRQFDCVTFCESTIALARCIRLRGLTFGEFRRQLRFIRYRSGAIRGYASRLHYFTDWIEDNCRKKVVRDITKDLGGVGYTRATNFMSTHPSSYRQLAANVVLEEIKAAEARISATKHYYIPGNRVASVQEQLRSGDILALVPSTEGIDVTHTGIAVVSDRDVKYLHAPLSGGNVRESEVSLPDYLQKLSKNLGIVVARPLEPS